MNEHFQCKPYTQNNRFCTGNPDPILALVAMVLCGLGGWQGRMMWGWHTSLLLLLGQGPAGLFPLFSLHPTAAGSSLHLLIRSSGQAAAPDASLGLCPGGGTFSQASKLFLADQNASFGCVPLYWISLHLPAPGF